MMLLLAFDAALVRPALSAASVLASSRMLLMRLLLLLVSVVAAHHLEVVGTATSAVVRAHRRLVRAATRLQGLGVRMGLNEWTGGQ